MDFLWVIVNTFLGMIFGHTIVRVWHQVGNIFNYRTNVDNLEIVFGRLKTHEVAIKKRVDQANRENEEEILAHVEKWMEDLQGDVKKVNEIRIDVEEHAKASFYFWPFSYLIQRHKLSRRANEIAGSLVDLENRGQFNQVSYRPPLQIYVQNKHYEDFGSRELTMNEVMKALEDPNISTVGVFGMPGIGKTTFAKEVARRALDEKFFDRAIVVVVSRVPILEKIQKEIADLLGLKLKVDTLQARADKLRRRLGKENKILITLDDIWNKLELDEVGISFGGHQTGCKILLTSRFGSVVRNDMKAESFKLELLSHNEASSLFNKMVGDSAQELDLQLIVEKIIQECACLPIAIVVVAAVLKNQPSYCWEDELRALQKPSSISIGEMSQDLYKSIRLSYDFLARKDARYLLLLCSIHEEDEEINVENLVEYGIGLDLFQGITKFKDARIRVLKLVHDLKAACLLLDGRRKIFVKMHDVIRDVCLSIASRDEGMHFIGDITELVQCIKNNKFVDATAISLSFINVNQVCERLNHLHESLKFPRLKLVLIRHRYRIKDMSKGSLDEHFFEEMKDLRVLSLKNVKVKLTCFSQLQNLQTLCLRSCNVGDITPIGELKKLEILNLEFSDILKVPREIGKLTLLRSLVLANCYNIYHVEPHVISSLKNLEQLNMESGRWSWKVEGVEGEISNASLKELTDLNELTTLNICIPDVNSLPKIWINVFLKRYLIKVGVCSNLNMNWELYYNKERNTPKKLILVLEESHLIKEHGIENLMKGTKELHLEGLNDVNDVFELDKNGFPQLEHLMFQDNGSAQYITNSSDPYSAFLNLKSIVLINMMNLEKIYLGKLKVGSFGKLEEVVVRKCDGIKRLFSFSIAKQFKEIEVWDCSTLKEIVVGHESEYESSECESSNETKFCQLITLKLKDLPMITQFFLPEVETISTSEMGECRLSIVDSLFNVKVIFPKLAHMELSRLNVGKLFPDDVSFMQNLRELIVDNCDGLNYLLSYDVAKGLQLIEHLEVKNCNALEEVIAVKGLWEKMLLPKLHTLVLCNLQKLSRFCSECCIEYPSLKVLELKECSQLGDLALIGVSFMQNLTKLIVHNCNGLNYLLSYDVAKGLEQLEHLEVENCKALEEVITIKKPWGSIESIKKMLLPKLHTLVLCNLQKLARFCSECHIEYPWLKVLKLKECSQLEILASIGELNNLEELDFSYWSSIIELPRGIERLTQLKKLNLSGCTSLKAIQPNILSKLVHLQELEMFGIPVTWEAEGVLSGERTNASLKELKDLPQLTTLSLYLPDVSIVPKDLFSENLDSYYITIGEFSKIVEFSSEYFYGPFDRKRLKLMLNLKKSELVRELGLQVLLKSCTELHLHGFQDEIDFLYNLEYMELFPQLFYVNVANCARVKHLFPYSFSNTIELCELEVVDCVAMEAIVTYERDHDLDYQHSNDPNFNKIVLSRLRRLIFRNLPRLVQFYSEVETSIISRPGDDLSEEEFQIFVPFFARKVHMPDLRYLVMDLVDCRQIWGHELVLGFKNLKSLKVSRCHHLKSLMSYSMIINLTSLIHLEVCNCEKMEEVISMSGKERCLDLITFIKLKYLIIKDLPKLRRFSAANGIICPLLSSLTLINCLNLRAFVTISAQAPTKHTFFGGKVMFPTLKYAKVGHSEIINEIFNSEGESSVNSFGKLEELHSECSSQDESVVLQLSDRLKSFIPPSVSFQCLKILRVSKCSGLMNLFASSVVKGLVNLKKMIIYGCESMTEIVEIDEGLVEKEIVFEQLKTLVLVHLPSLRCFYSGNSTITFPNLRTLVVSQCPEMQTFSHGIVNSPTVNSIITELEFENGKLVGEEVEVSYLISTMNRRRWKEECWEHNINDTIRKMFEQRCQLNQS